MSRIDPMLDQYSGDHLNPTNQLIHVICVPAIAWSVSAMLWTIPVPSAWFKPGTWFAFGAFIAFAWYWRQSRKLAIGMLLCFVAAGFLNRWIVDTWGMRNLLYAGIAVFVLAWIAQFIGHKIEGKRPSFLTDLVYLLVGPAWTLDKLYRRVGIGH